MAISKTIIKLNHIEAVVKVVNDSTSLDTVTIELSTDLLKSNETIVGTPKVAISDMEFTVEESLGILISRNSENLYQLEHTGNFKLSHGADHTNEIDDIVVSMGRGTLLLKLIKANGYDPMFKPEQGIG